MPPVTVACYYFPNYHPSDARNQAAKGPGWSEWELVKQARPRFPGHRQPKIPAWGYADEADPAVMARKIDAAADHGIDAFIFDWYWYDDGPFLERALDRGFLGASNVGRLRFALMWANHDWQEIHPWRLRGPRPVLYPGRVTPATFDTLCRHVIDRYFLHPSYWRIDGKPYFSIYELYKLVESFGSVDATRDALARFDALARRAGLPGIHFNAVCWGVKVLPGETTVANPADLVARLGFHSVTSYVWIHHVRLPELETDFNWVRDRYFEYWDRAAAQFPIPYLPNVTMGWDASPRAHQDDPYDPTGGYPFMHTIANNTPARFQEALRLTRDRLLASRAPLPIVTVNCWNEWTEGSYLEPDQEHGTACLEAVKAVKYEL